MRRLILNPTTDNLISFLAEAFEEIEGVPNELVIDNLKAFVEKPRSSSEDNAVLTSRFSEFCKDYDIDVFACMPYRPQTKGKTETQNKWVEQLYNYNGTFGGLWEMHHRLKQLNDEDNMAASQATQLPRQFLLEKEKGDLAPLPSPAVRHPYHLHLKKVHVTNDALFQYRYNKYSLAKEFIGKPVEIVVQNNKLHIYYNGNIIDVHPITDNHFNIKPEHQLYYAKTKDDKVEKNAIEAPPAPNIISTELGDIRYDSLSKIQEQLTYLKFKSAQHYLEQLFHDCQLTEAELSGLYKVLAKEVEAKEENKSLYNVKVAAFPYLKTIDDYDFSFQPSIDEDQIRAIIDSSFYEEAKNVVLVGNPGTGKTHLAISIAYSVAIKRNSVYFIKFNKLIQSLRTAYQEGALERKIKVLFKYKLLVIDEVGFNEISPLEAKLFFQLIDWSYTKRFTVFASNLTFDKWHTIMGQDEMLTKAIVDRILHHAYLFNITGPSYRIKDKISPPKSGES